MKEIISDINPLGFQWKTYDPFLFSAHHYDKYPEGNEIQGPKASLESRNLGQDFSLKDGWRMYHGQKIPGFPVHPHRGFETITIVLEGFVDHSDSMGAGGRYGEGDVQWMTAGKGMQHSEMFPCIYKDKPNTLHLFQIWLNLPKKSKFVEPDYKMLWAEDIPIYDEKDDMGNSISVRIIAGSYKELKAISPPVDSWASDSNNNVNIWIVKLAPGAKWSLPETTSNTARTLYYYEGKGLKVRDKDISANNSFKVKPDTTVSLKNTEEESCLLLLQGNPINEPIAQHGPFVMNNQKEIVQAFSDYQNTQFGGWPWDSPEPVHRDEAIRFAKFPDGRIENRN